MKNFILALLLIVSSYAHAAQIEVGVGESYFQRSVTSTWWQAGFPAQFEASFGKSTNTTNMAYSLGLTGMVSDNLRWRAGFASLGTPAYNRLATPFAAADDIDAGEGAGPYYWTASQQQQELYATVAPEWKVGSFTISVEGGLTFYKPTRHQDISVGANGENSSWSPTVSPIIGASIGYGKTSLVFQIQQHVTVGDNDGGFFPQEVSTVSLRHIF